MATKQMNLAAGLAGLVLVGMAPGSAAQTCTPANEARYRLTFDSTWSAQTLPQQFPANAHFSGLVGGVHGASVSFWQPGQLASNGIELMAETGSKSALLGEVNAAVGAGTALATISGGSLPVTPGTVSVEFDLTQSHSRATVVTMIAPSPDWFVGVNGFDLFAGGSWSSEVAANLYGFDAGTDSGTTYASPNNDTNPPEPVAQLDGPLFMNGGILMAFGRFTFQRLTAACTDEDGDGVADDEDNCSAISNGAQVDADEDGYGNACDADLNNDCVVNTQDLGLLKIAFFGADPVADLNADGMVNVLDLGLMKSGFFSPPGPSGSGGDCDIGG